MTSAPGNPGALVCFYINNRITDPLRKLKALNNTLSV